MIYIYIYIYTHNSKPVLECRNFQHRNRSGARPAGLPNNENIFYFVVRTNTPLPEDRLLDMCAYFRRTVRALHYARRVYYLCPKRVRLFFNRALLNRKVRIIVLNTCYTMRTGNVDKYGLYVVTG